jgi:hypothetical protein
VVDEDVEVAALEFDQILAHPRFRNLCLFSITHKQTDTMFTPEVRLQMPLANARGIFK